MIVIFIIAAAAFLIYILAVRCRSGHSGLASLRGWAYAHRGLHGNGVPENSMAAFRSALESGYGIELDIHLLRDGNLAVIHDASLKRTAGADVRIEDLRTEDLASYKLEGTDETIPTFRQVLDLFAGKAPLIVELKPVGDNVETLCQATCNMLEDYAGPYCIESFDPRCIVWLKKHKPQIIRGQLSENFCKGKGKLSPFLKFVMTHHLELFLCVPDFVAYKFADRKTLGNVIARKIWGAQGVTWTLRSQEDFDTAVNEGWLPIFEGFRP